MDRLRFLLSSMMVLSAIAVSFSATITYQEDSTNFPNPERGYYVSGLSSSGLQEGRKQAMTVCRKYYRIDAYVNSDLLPQSVLDGINNDAAILRQAGAKMVPRFNYNCGGCNNPTLARILMHIEQLTPVLRSNSDVIAFFEAGFIGMCGEWHYYGCTPENNHNTTAARSAVLFKLLNAVPNRMVALRYNFHKRGIFGDVPLGPDSAFTGTYAARTGAHNDCLGYNESDRGTYQGPKTTEWQKNYLNQDNRYVPQGGETCGNSSYCNCTVALTDMKRMHWDVINSGYDKNVINGWQSGGCNETIKKLLGYRLKMISAQLPDAVRPGAMFSGEINLINIGWGKIYNPRGCELVFRNIATKSKFIVKLANDPRHWCMTDSAVIVPLEAQIPPSTPEGSYLVYLNLPDTAASIYNRPEYSIRLANKNVWEDSTGYNSLLHTVTVSNTAPAINSLKQRMFTGQGCISSDRHGTSVEISITVRSASTVICELFTLSGALIMRKAAAETEPGRHTVLWNASQGSFKICFVRFTSNGSTLGGRLVNF